MLRDNFLKLFIIKGVAYTEINLRGQNLREAKNSILSEI